MKASVIVPMYNARRYIANTIDSILPQLSDDMELLVIDDGSTDGSSEVVDAYGRHSIRLIRIPNSGGPARPRNEGIKAARGDIIFIFDADDIMMPGKIAATLDAFAECPDAAMLFTDFQSIDSDGCLLNADYLAGYDFMRRHRKRDGKPMQIDRADAYRSLAFENYIGTSSVAIRKSCLDRTGGFDEMLKNSDDRDMWFRLTREFDVIYLPRVLHGYRIHGGSISHRSTRTRVDSKVAVLKKQLPYAPDADFRRQIMHLCASNYFSLAFEQLKCGESDEALHNIWQSMRHEFRPHQLKLLARYLLQKISIKK